MVKKAAKPPAHPPTTGQLPGFPAVQQTDLDRQTVYKALQALHASLSRARARHAPGTPLRSAYDGEMLSCERLLATYRKETPP